jgi:alpha-galactosidase
MTAWGDWNSLKPEKFSHSMKSISTAMKARGMRPGIWLAPFAADKHSDLVKRHPDWIIRNDSGRPANSSNCGKFFYGLDATNPQVLEHARNTIKLAVDEWGFEVLKLDFLYACCLQGNGKYDLSMTRAETMTLALQTLRDAAGEDVFIIGCGCPIGPGVGIVDGMRVSADTGPTWYPSFPLPWWDNATLPCLRAMVRNSLSRAPLSHRWFHNDPDCLLLGSSTDLSTPEVLSAATVIGMTGGMLLVSDDIGKLPAERLEILSKLIPLPRAVGQPLDLHCSYDNSIPSIVQLWCSDNPQCKEFESHTIASMRTGSFRSCVPVCSGLGQWAMVSLSNWLEVDAVVSAPFCSLVSFPTLGNDYGIKDCSGGYHVFTFWSSKYVWIPALSSHPSVQRRKRTGGSRHKLSKRLGPHQSEIFHLKPVAPNGQPQYIGSDYHFTCGMEVKEWTSDDHQLVIAFHPQFVQQKAGKVFLSIPSDSNAAENGVIHAVMDGSSLEVTVLHNILSIYRSVVIRVRIPSNSASNRLVITY